MISLVAGISVFVMLITVIGSMYLIWKIQGRVQRYHFVIAVVLIGLSCIPVVGVVVTFLTILLLITSLLDHYSRQVLSWLSKDVVRKD